MFTWNASEENVFRIKLGLFIHPDNQLWENSSENVKERITHLSDVAK